MYNYHDTMHTVFFIQKSMFGHSNTYICADQNNKSSAEQWRIAMQHLWRTRTDTRVIFRGYFAHLLFATPKKREKKLQASLVYSEGE